MPLRNRVLVAPLVALALIAPGSASAQNGYTHGGRAVINGQVVDASGRGLQGATIYIDQRHFASSLADGAFAIGDLAPGRYVVHARFVGDAPDSVVANVKDDGATVIIRLKPAAVLSTVRVEAVRLSGQARSLNRQRVADSLVTVSTNEEIMALPNANGADAFARMPGVSLQRHEGEGSAVQVRGIDANLTSVTLNGAHMGGKSEDSPGGDRRVYLDGMPASLLGAAVLSKTLTPDMDADAVGGSVGMETLSADAAPGIRLAGNYGRSDLQNAPAWLGSASYGKRYNRTTALFIGYSADHNSRVYDDVEPTYARIKLPSGDSTNVPTSTSAREYWTDRMRQGGTVRLDWKPVENTTLNIIGLISNFHDYAVRYRQDHTLVRQRLYTDADIRRFRLLAAATRNGRNISLVAGLTDGDITRLVADDESAGPQVAARGAPSLSRVIDAALVPIAALDATTLDAQLRRVIAREGTTWFLDPFVPALMRGIGDGWTAGRISIAEEHLASAVVHGLVMETVRFATTAPTAPCILVATPSGDLHAVGAALVAAAAAIEGWAVKYLGVNVPAAEIVRAAGAIGARAVALSAVYAVDPHSVTDAFRAVRDGLAADVPLIVGGPLAGPAAAGLSSFGIVTCDDMASLRATLVREAMRA